MLRLSVFFTVLIAVTAAVEDLDNLEERANHVQQDDGDNFTLAIRPNS